MEQGVDIVAALLLADDIGSTPITIDPSDEGSAGGSNADWATAQSMDGSVVVPHVEIMVIDFYGILFSIYRAAMRFDTSTIAKVSSVLLKFTPQLGIVGSVIVDATNVFVCRPTIASYVFPTEAKAIYQEVRAGYLASPWGAMTEVGGKYVYDLTANYASTAQFDIGLAELLHDVGGNEPTAGTLLSLKGVDPYLELVSSGLDSPGLGGDKGDWAIFKWQEPSRPLKCITLYELDGDRLGRDPRPPRDLTIMPRVQIRVRSPEAPEAMTKLQYIEMIMDAAINKTVTLSPPVGDDYTVLVKHVQRSDNFMPIGRDDNGAFLWTLDLRIALG